jgi:hypothetical protein
VPFYQCSLFRILDDVSRSRSRDVVVVLRVSGYIRGMLSTGMGASSMQVDE